VITVPHVKIDSTEYYYRISKRGLNKKTAAVCLHGSGADGVVWSYQLSRLSKDYKIISVDLPGHGRSGGTPLESTGTYAQWFDQLRTALGLSSFFIFGHSLGGAIAQEYAHAYPEKVQGLVLVATGTTFMISRIHNEIINNPQHSEDTAQKWNEYSNAYDLRLKISDRETFFEDMPAAAGFDSTNWIATVRIPVPRAVAPFTRATHARTTACGATARKGATRTRTNAPPRGIPARTTGCGATA